VPGWIEVVAAPVDIVEDYRRISMWSGDLYGLDWSPVRSLAANNVYSVTLEPSALLAEPETIVRVDLHRAEAVDAAGEASFAVARDGVLHGVGVWFAAGLSPSVRISTAPPNEMKSWSHAFFPVERPVEVAAGTAVEVALRSVGNGRVWEWRVAVGGTDADARDVFHHSTFRGFALTREKVRALASDRARALRDPG
jgi:hypothetical protein